MSDVLVTPEGRRGAAREMLRVKHGTYFVADCASIDEVSQLARR